jgi:hypothetical protein
MIRLNDAERAASRGLQPGDRFAIGGDHPRVGVNAQSAERIAVIEHLAH